MMHIIRNTGHFKQIQLLLSWLIFWKHIYWINVCIHFRLYHVAFRTIMGREIAHHLWIMFLRNFRKGLGMAFHLSQLHFNLMYCQVMNRILRGPISSTKANKEQNRYQIPPRSLKTVCWLADWQWQLHFNPPIMILALFRHSKVYL